MWRLEGLGLMRVCIVWGKTLLYRGVLLLVPVLLSGHCVMEP